jgi:TolB protein
MKKVRTFAMKICPLAGGLLFAGATLVGAAERHIAFERDDFVWIANLDGTGERKMAAGISPSISPNATRLAFTTVDKSGTTSIRHIAVIDISSVEMKVFKDVPSNNVYYPSWSPDGKRILFTLRRDDVSDFATIAPDGTEFKVLKKGAPNEATLYSPCWARDGGSIFCQDMTNIYQIGLDGRVLEKWTIEKFIPNAGMSSNGRIDLSPDGKRLLLSLEMGEESNRKNWDGPLPALWTFEIATQQAMRVTSKSLFGWDGCWLDNENILFSSQPASENEVSIYRISKDGKNLKRLIKNGRRPQR